MNTVTIDEEKMLNLHPIPTDNPKSTNHNDKSFKIVNEGDEIFDYELLSLIDKPTGSSTPLLSINYCEGHLDRLPLKLPNADLNNPQSIVDMVNILTKQGAEAEFKKALDNNENFEQDRAQGDLTAIFSVDSELMKNMLKSAKKRTVHKRAFTSFGHVVNPGCASFYQKDGLTYAVTEGRWILFSERAKWIKKNVSLQEETITFEDSTVMIIRINPGKIGKIFEQGVEKLLDVGTHVFNSGTVSFEGTVAINDNAYFNHGRYHYLRVSRGDYAKVWVGE